MLIAAQAMGKFQSIHNLIRKDYIELLTITEKNLSNQKTFDALYRASLKSLFSIVEADIFGLNNLDPYPNYDDRHAFISKFEKTFKQVSKTWKKEDIRKKYFSSCKPQMKILKRMRDEIIHPKEIEHIHNASQVEFQKLKSVFYDYDSFMNELMKDFFLSTEIKFNFNENRNNR